MSEEILSEIRNKLTVPVTALERMAQGKPVPKGFLELAVAELRKAAALLRNPEAVQ
jgi:hypothetical protein